MRTETDSFGNIDVPDSALWGAQTARSLQFFAIGAQRMPAGVLRAIAWIKWAAAKVNADLGLLPADVANAVADAAQRIANGEFADEFPLSVFQTGSGTQSNMNVNEVIASVASQSLAKKVHPNDVVNLGQSSNDVFPSAMHMAAALAAKSTLLPALSACMSAFEAKVHAFHGVIKIGRTHLQDATPITLGQEFSGYLAQLRLCERAILHALVPVHDLALGGTAVGTGLNTHPQFAGRAIALLAEKLSLPLQQSGNLFAAMAGHEALVGFHSSLKMLSIALTKIACDIRLMGSGPRAGFGELALPENEPGSSIMPGKVNPTQIEALTMVCAQVFGHDAAISFAASQGQFELNVYKPLIAFNTLDSIHLLSDAMRSFTQHCLLGINVNTERVSELLHSSLMLVTALNPHIGYDRAAKIAKHAHQHQLSLRAAALALGEVTEAEFDAWVLPSQMLGDARPH
jgi:fumarate hydratase, class II